MLNAQIEFRVEKVMMAKLYPNCHVDAGEFVYNYNDVENKQLAKRDYVAILKNNDNALVGFMYKDGLVKYPMAIHNVKKLRIGFDHGFYVVSKSDSYMELNANDNLIEHDTIVGLFENGYVYGESGNYYYRAYSDTVVGVKTYCVPDKTFIRESKNIDVVFHDGRHHTIHIEKGHEVYVTSDDHYFLVYKTEYMDEALAVVNGKGYVLDGDFDDLRFKFSEDGNNWIACCNDYLLVNGIKIKFNDKQIRDFFINNNGECSCVLDYYLDGKKTSDLFINGQFHLENVELYSLQLINTVEWIYRFKKTGKLYEGVGFVYQDYTNKSFYFDYDAVVVYDKDCMIKSKDGKHCFKINENNFEIDRYRYESVKPYSVYWDNHKSCFVWTTIEGGYLFINKLGLK